MHSAQKGFTLAELLIALALLGVIAAFTIPKVLNASSTNEAGAKIREAVSSVEGAWYNRKTAGTVTPGSSLWRTLASSFNGINQDVATSAGTPVPATVLPAGHPCGTATFSGGNGWVQFANGVVITGMAGPINIAALTTTPVAQNNTLICIDLNGQATPNTPGTDIFAGDFNQWGDFDAAGAAFAPADGKAFFWGNGTTGVFAAAGGDLAGGVGTIGDVAASAGYMLNQ